MVECATRSEQAREAAGTRPTRSEPSRRDLLIAIMVFVTIVICLFPLLPVASLDADEGMTLDGAQRILNGQVPYRDFFLFFTPGSYYLLALSFKLFGNSLVVARSVLLVTYGLFGAITYSLARCMSGRSGSITACVLVLECAVPAFLSLHNWYSSLYALFAVYSAHRLLDTPKRSWAFLLGIAASLTFLTEQSKGAGLLLGLMIAVLALLLRNRGRRSFSFAQLSWVLAGSALPLIFTFAYFTSQHALSAMLAAWFWPIHHYSSVNRVPYGFAPQIGTGIHAMFASGPSLQKLLLGFLRLPYLLIPALAVMVLVTTAYRIGALWKTSCEFNHQVLGGCIFFGVWLSAIATGRADVSHMMYLAPLFVYLLPSIFDFPAPQTQFLDSIRPLVGGFLLLSFCGFGLVPFLAPLKLPQLHTYRGNVRIPQEDQVTAYLSSALGKGEHVYVHPYQPFYSYITGTANPTSYQFLFPGMNTPEQYRWVVHELASDRTPFVLIDPNFPERVARNWPSTPLEAVTSDPVSDYILRNYRLCKLLNPQPSVYYFMVRKDLSCPSS